MSCQTSRIVFTGKEQVACETVELPEPGPNELLVRNHYSVISPGTELAFLCQLPNTSAVFPMYPGYSSSGEVARVGSEVTGFEIGERVVLQLPHASSAIVAPAQCWKLPAGLCMRTAAAFRLVSIPLQGIRKAQIQLGESVLVFGLGVIGNLAGQLARASGATRVIGIDPLSWRRELALESGFDRALAPDDLEHAVTLCEPGGARVVIEATGAPKVANSAFEAAARLGRVVLLGSTRGNTPEVNFYLHVHRKGLTIIGAHDSVRAAAEDVGPFWTIHSDGTTSLDLLDGKRVRVEKLLTDYPATSASEAYLGLLQPDNRSMSVILDWNERKTE